MNKRLAAATSQTIKDVEAMKVRVGNSTSNPTPRTNLPNDTISSEND
jgi:hypothetical protein